MSPALMKFTVGIELQKKKTTMKKKYAAGR